MKYYILYYSNYSLSFLLIVHALYPLRINNTKQFFLSSFLFLSGFREAGERFPHFEIVASSDVYLFGKDNTTWKCSQGWYQMKIRKRFNKGGFLVLLYRFLLLF